MFIKNLRQLRVQYIYLHTTKCLLKYVDFFEKKIDQPKFLGFLDQYVFQIFMMFSFTKFKVKI